MTNTLNSVPRFQVEDHARRKTRSSRLSAGLPSSIRLSILTQFLVISRFVVVSTSLGRPASTIAGAVALVGLLLIAFFLSTGSRNFWLGACRCSLFAMLAVLCVTCFAALSSPRHGAVGLCACLVLLHYRMALLSPAAHEFFGVESLSRLTHTTRNGRVLRNSWHGRRVRLSARSHRLWMIVCIGILMHASSPPCHGAVLAEDQLELLLAQVPDEFARQRDSTVYVLKRYREFSRTNKAKAINELTVRLKNAAQSTGVVSHETLAIRSTLEWLEGDSSPPKNPMATAWIVNYAENVIKQQSGVLKQLTILSNRLKKAGHTDELNMLIDAFRRLESEREISELLLAGRQFTGYRTSTDGKTLIPLLFKFSAESLSDSQFAGRVERDFMYRGNPDHHCSGQFGANTVTIQTGSVRAFGSKSDHAWTYSGCLIGRSLIGRYAGIDKKGKPKGGLFIVRTGR